MEFFHQQGAISILRIFLLVGSGAVVGMWCEGVARAYAGALVAGAQPDAACLRTASRRALYRFSPTPVNLAYAAQDRLAGIVCAIILAACFVRLYVLHGDSLYFLALATVSAALLMLALIDARTRLLPDALTLPLLWSGIALAWLGHGLDLHDAIAGAMLGYGFLWLLFWLFKGLSGREGMGYGDFKLLAALGAWLGWRPLVSVLFVACVVGVLFAMARQRTLRPTGSYPFGPFLAAAGIAALMTGSDVHSYFW